VRSDPGVIATVRALRAGQTSRNRDFRTFAVEPGRTALRVHRLLRSIEADLEAGARLEAAALGGGVRLRVHRDDLALVRTVILSADEYALLADARH